MMRLWLHETRHHTLDSKLEYEQYSNNIIYVFTFKEEELSLLILKTELNYVVL